MKEKDLNELLKIADKSKDNKCCPNCGKTEASGTSLKGATEKMLNRINSSAYYEWRELHSCSVCGTIYSIEKTQA